MHRTQPRLLPPACLLATLLSLSACGGGGGSPGGAPPPTSNPPPTTNPPPATPRAGTAPTAQPGQFLVFQDGSKSIYKYDLDTDTVSRLWEAPGPTVVTSQLVISPDGQSIAFTFYKGAERSDIWVMAADGSGLARAGAPPLGGAGASDFVWSPDSSKLAFLKHVPFIEAESGTEQSYVEMWLVDRDGNNRRKLSETVADPNDADEIDQIQWSPDGRFVSWTLLDAPNWNRYALELHDVQAGGSNRRRILAPVGLSKRWLREYEWAPDSSRIAFGAGIAYDAHVFTVRPDATGLAEVSPPLSVSSPALSFRWSPDGSRLACLAGTQDVLELYTVAPDGTGMVKLNAPLSAGRKVGEHLAWAPDGSRIAYEIRGIRDNAAPELYTVRPDGSDAVRLNTPPAAETILDLFKWSPDSSWIAYRHGSQYENRKVYVVRADGSDRFEVNGMLAADPVPGKGQYSPNSQHFDWSPDSTYLFHVAENGTTGSPAELFTLRANTKEYVKLNDPPAASTTLEYAVFAWSNDGSRAAYVADDNGDNIKDLFLVAPNGASYKNISKSFNLVGVEERIWGEPHFSWSP